MLRLFDGLISDIESKASGLSNEELLDMFRLIPIEVFGQLLVERPQAYPNLVSRLPVMASEEVQQAWTGSSGHTLMKQSVSFIRLVCSTYHTLSAKPISESRILDFGCGWGRLIRLLYKYTTGDRIYAVDPWDKSIELCREADLAGHFFISDYLPRELPIPSDVKFDLIYAFSVFTHLSGKATKIALDTLSHSLAEGGVIAITVRPKEYWPFARSMDDKISAEEVENLVAQHESEKFSFRPHNREKIEGEVTYGDSSFSISYLEENFDTLKVSSIEWSESDPYQLVIFLQRK